MFEQKLSWINRLEKLIQQKQMLLHPFYQAWSCGMLKKSTLQRYAKEYYQHVKAFPTYLSALHSRCADPKIRRSLLQNLIDEEGGDPSHPELWRSFALALGTTAEDLDHHKPHPSTQALIEAFRTSCCSQPLALGLAALYSYESQIPAICQTKIEGLKKWYGFTDPESYRYFSVHESADIEHSRAEREALMTLVTPEQEESVLGGAETILNALWDFLDAIEEGEKREGD
jgi:pyrroloquinoline-quinone synthase